MPLLLQADREALQLRRKLLTRLLQEAKTAWLQLRPREEAIRRALSGQAPLPTAAEQLPAPDRDEEAPGLELEAAQPAQAAGEGFLPDRAGLRTSVRRLVHVQMF